MDISRNHYREVLSALEAGPKSGEQIQKQVGFPDIDHCSAILAKLSGHQYIAKAYVITDEGKKALHLEADNGVQSSRPPAVPIKPTMTFTTTRFKQPKIRMVGGFPHVVKERD